MSLRAEFIRNIAHEFHTPQTGITSMAEALYHGYDRLSDSQRKLAAKTIFKSAARFESYSDNIINLAKLSANPYYDLKITKVDLSKLVYDRIDLCRKLYIEEESDRTFTFNVEKKIVTDCDQYYIGQALDNLIINAINYCKKGQINIILKRTTESIEFSISDEGIGIPKEEIYDIFGAFLVSSKTHTSAGGRGIGLALCKRVIEVHSGTIKAKSNGEKGATFIFTLPILV